MRKNIRDGKVLSKRIKNGLNNYELQIMNYECKVLIEEMEDSDDRAESPIYNIMKNILIIVIFITLFASCEKSPKKIQFGGEIQGTYYKVIYFDSQSRNFHKEIDSLLHRFDLTASLWVENSLINRINENDKSVVLNKDFIRLFELSKKIHQQTDGTFNPAIGAIVNVWGFGAKGKVKPDSTLIDSLLLISDFESVSLDENNQIVKEIAELQFDFNAIAQGYSVDLVGEFLLSKGIKSYLIDIGGELLAKGHKPDQQLWSVGIESPNENSQYGDELQTIIQLENKAIATSGSYRKFYVEDGIKYSHTIDPKTGYPVTHNLLSATVIAKDCATADALATALMVMGTEGAVAFSEANPEYSVYLISVMKGKEYYIWQNASFKSFVR
jgi:thiamine biosynthesis lipoprotein